MHDLGPLHHLLLIHTVGLADLLCGNVDIDIPFE